MTHKLCSYTLYQILLFADKNTIIKLILGCKLEQLKDNHWIDIINTYVSGYVSLNRNPKYDLCRILQGMICWQCFKASETRFLSMSYSITFTVILSFKLIISDG